MQKLYVLFLLLSAVCFIASTFGAKVPRLHLPSLGLFFWVLVPLIVTARQLN